MLDAVDRSYPSFAHQSLGDRHKTLYIQLVLAHVQHLERPVPLQYLRDVSKTVLQTMYQNWRHI